MTETDLVLRTPTAEDAVAVYDLVRRCGALEPNTAYAYLLLCTDFAGTCIVAELQGRVIGCVLGYRPPDRPDTVFVWQVGVDVEARGQGLASRLVNALVDTDACSGVRWLEATVAPSNAASMRLFRGVARRRNVECYEEPRFEPHHFPESAHEAEHRLRIGPFSDPRTP